MENTNVIEKEIDVLIPFEEEEDVVCIPLIEYRELVLKANALDMLADDIRFAIDNDKPSYEIVDEKLVRALTGTRHYTKTASKEAPEEQNE